MKVLAENRRARYDYFLHDKFETGLALQGWEVKSATASHVSIGESFIHFEDRRGELWLKNAYFAPYKDGDVNAQNLRRNRKLLLHKSEIAKIVRGTQQKGCTCVPLRLYRNDAGLIKLEIALATGKQAHDKREAIKQRDIARELRKF